MRKQKKCCQPAKATAFFLRAKDIGQRAGRHLSLCRTHSPVSGLEIEELQPWCAPFEKDYLMGKYGGVPVVGIFERLFNHESNEE